MQYYFIGLYYFIMNNLTASQRRQLATVMNTISAMIFVKYGLGFFDSPDPVSATKIFQFLCAIIASITAWVFSIFIANDDYKKTGE